MLLLSRYVSVLALAAVSLAQGDNKPFPVTGVPVSPQGPVPLRQNINNLQNSGGAQWDLYIQALAAMQKLDSADPLGYFQIAGIHGAPFIQWNGAGGRQGNGWLGYCPHGESIFLTWHRPYVLLYEQILVSTAKKIAASYPPRYRYQYQQAAETLRSPYWDWAAESAVPRATVPATLKITVADGEGLKQVDFSNPLSAFNFPSEALRGKYGTFNPNNQDHIIRCPPPNQNYPGTANQNLQARPYKKWVYDILTRPTNFLDFASTTSGINVEQIHNAIHWDGACANQFLSADYSAFDPLFMLHHTNVDRLWAYWQAMNPDAAIFSNSYRGQSRYSTPSGTVITPQSPLQPFFQANGNFHTTESVKSIQGMGYAYQALEYWQKSPGQMKSDTMKLISKLYGSGTAANKRSWKGRLVPRATDRKETRYFARIEVDVTEVERPCEISVYVCGQKVGGLVVMMLPAEGLVKGGFTVDQAIQTVQQSDDKAANNTVDAFNNRLEVGIAKPDGTTIPVDSVPSLRIQLETVTVTLPSSDDQRPKYGAGSLHRVIPADRSDS